MKESEALQEKLLKIFALLLALSIALNAILLIRRNEVTRESKTLVSQNQAMIQKINRYKTEIEKYKGISPKIDNVIVDANKEMEAMERRITRLVADKKAVEDERDILSEHADSLREIYLNVIDSLLVEREARKVINQKIEHLEEVIEGLNNKLGYASLLNADNLVIRPVWITISGKKTPTALARRVDYIEFRYDIVQNNVARPGLKNIYIVITTPDARVLADKSTGNPLEFNHPDYKKKAQCSSIESFNYKNEKIALSSRFNPGEALYPGLYVAEIFTDENKLAMQTFSLR